jgi:ribosomal protein S18 acetylase RimI-like enzyme
MVNNRKPATVEATPADLRYEVLHLLHLERTQVRSMLVAGERGAVDLNGLFHACRGDRLVGAAWGQKIPGRTAFCWPACLVTGEPEATATALQKAVDRFLNAADVAMAQAVVDVHAVRDMRRLEKAGYRHLADLDYLVCSADGFPQKEPACDLQFEACRVNADERLAELIQRTYEGTLDCPDVDGWRGMDDVLAGYRHTGVHHPEWWIIFRHGNKDVGCLLLADHPEHEQCELMYVGVVPEKRGRGWGLQATRHAQWLGWRAGRQRMVLAVDEANWPALRVYQAAGFERWDRRAVFVRAVREGF